MLFYWGCSRTPGPPWTPLAAKCIEIKIRKVSNRLEWDRNRLKTNPKNNFLMAYFDFSGSLN